MLDARAYDLQLQLASMLILYVVPKRNVPLRCQPKYAEVPLGPLSAITLTKIPTTSPLCSDLLLFAIGIGSRSIRHVFDMDTLSLGFSGFGFRGSLLILLGFQSSFFLCLPPRFFVLPLVFFAQCFGLELVPVAF